jgi:cell division protein FtsI (penicillin-binding protein 3)
MMPSAGRVWSIFMAILLGFIFLAGGSWYVMIVQSAFLQQEGDKRQIRNFTLPAARGAIMDRRGHVLAMSTPMVSVAIDPKTLNHKTDYQTSLASALSLPLEVVQEKIRTNANKNFVYLKRGLTPLQAQTIEKLPLIGVHLVPEYKRFYPAGEVMAHIVGFTNIDDQGIEGTELSYNEWLRGVPGVKRVIRDNLGRVIDTLDEIRPAKEGKSLRLSIDRDLQFEKSFMEPLRSITEVINWDVDNRATLEDFFG